MPRKKQYKVHTLYFSKRLKKKLSKIKEYPMTLVEAPSGYGKTTALRSFFDHEELSGVPVYWLTFLGETLPVIWEEFCKIISRLDPEQGEILAALAAPGEDDLLQISRILEKLQCSAETYIVLDNFGDINIEYIDEQYNSDRLTQILRDVTDIIGAHILNNQDEGL